MAPEGFDRMKASTGRDIFGERTLLIVLAILVVLAIAVHLKIW
jgi:hypothetical protein